MKPAPFDYIAPGSVEEACAILAESGGGATVLAGGQTLVPLLNLRMSQPFILVDINRISGFSGVSRGDNGIRVGAGTRQRDALENELLAAELPAMVRALSHVGHHQTRNRGTIGGSIALGEPAAEMPATAVALGAMIEVTSVRGSRKIPAREFYLGPYMTVLEADELITAIEYPAWPKGHIPLFREVARRPGDFADVGLVGSLVIDGDKISRIGIAWFGMGPTPIVAKSAEAALAGQAIADIDVKAVAQLAIADTAPFDDSHSSAEYRRTVGARIFAQALSQALNSREAV